jgi:hypothetical protein
VITAGADTLPLIKTLEALLAEGSCSICGLTTFSTRMVVEHATAQWGLRVSFAYPHAAHSRAPSQLQQAGRRLAPTLERAFAAAVRSGSRVQRYAWLLVPGGPVSVPESV